MAPDDVTRLASSLVDRYRIERELGSGGMATVYLAHDLRHDRQVAVKNVFATAHVRGDTRPTSGVVAPTSGYLAFRCHQLQRKVPDRRHPRRVRAGTQPAKMYCAPSSCARATAITPDGTS